LAVAHILRVNCTEAAGDRQDNLHIKFTASFLLPKFKEYATPYGTIKFESEPILFKMRDFCYGLQI